MSFKHKIK